MANIDKIQVGDNTYNITSSSDATNTFTSGDVADGSATSWTTVAALASGETTGNILNKISNMFKNIRYLYKNMLKWTIDNDGSGNTSLQATIQNDINNNVATGTYSHAEGYHTTASGNSSHAEGYSTTAGNYSHAEGYMATASGAASHAEGESTVTSGTGSHAEGYMTTASGDYSHAEGYSTSASGYYSHAEGGSTTASRYYSHAEGHNTAASGDSSHAEGYGTSASGDFSHAEGYGTTASGYYSHAEGLDTIAGGYQHVEGRYNVSDTSNTYAHIVGNGTADDARSNAYTLDWSGNESLAGSLTLGMGTTAAITLTPAILNQLINSGGGSTYTNVTLSSNNWTLNNGTGYYTQSVTVQGVTSTSRIKINGLVYPSGTTLNSKLDIDYSASLLLNGDCSTNTITFSAVDIPSVSFTLELEVK